MAEIPLFIPSKESVKGLVGLKNTSGGSSTDSNFDECLREAKSTIWAQLGLSKIQEIQATEYTATPTTDEEYVRLIARQVEIDTIRWHLMDVMQLGFKGGEAEFLETWNTDGKFKRLSTNQLHEVRSKLWDSIARRIEILKGTATGGDLSKAKGFLIDADSAGYHTVALHRYSPYTGDILKELLKK